MSTLLQLQYRGFDLSTYNRSTRTWRVRCSQCEALCINGAATHEHNCPNARHKCKGCDELIPAKQKYCSDCSY